MNFPKPVQVPKEVQQARKERSSAILRVAFWGVIIRFAIAGFELAGYFVYKSSSLLMDSLATFADIAAGIVLIVTIKLAERPPDHEHPFGHGRYEPIVGLQLGIFLLVGGLGLFIQQCMGLITKPSYTIHLYVALIPLVAVIMLEITYRIMHRISKKENSPALEAEAFHFRVDSLNSIIAFIALIVAGLVPDYSALFDRIGALGIALFMCVVGCVAAKRNLSQLTDKIPEHKFFETVKRAAKSVEGVRETEKIRIQQYGPDAHVDIDVEVDPLLSVEKSHKISQYVRLAIQEAWPQVREVVVHIEPFYPNDHVKK